MYYNNYTLEDTAKKDAGIISRYLKESESAAKIELSMRLNAIIEKLRDSSEFIEDEFNEYRVYFLQNIEKKFKKVLIDIFDGVHHSKISNHAVLIESA